MSNEQISNSLTKLIEATRLVASDYNVQISIWPSYVHVPDEIALIFQDAYYSVDQLVEHGVLNENQHQGLKSLNKCLDEINSWSMDSLREADEWNYVRLVASNVLKVFNENSTKIPDLFWIQFVSEK